MPDLSAYHLAIAEARDRGLALAADQEAELMDLLAQYADELVALIQRTDVRRPDALREALREVQRLSADLATSSAERLGAGIRLTAEELARAHTRALGALLVGTTVGVPAGFAGVAARSAAAVIARPELVTALRTLRSGAESAVTRVIREGVLRGQPSTAMARELRMSIGAPGSLVEGDAALLRDRRRIGYKAIQELGYDPTPENLARVRQEARTIANKAQLLARNEIMTAEQEVQAQACATSPVVAAVQVRLSGRHPVRDQCDAAVHADLYGLGPGRFPPDKVPPRFHPRCICVFTHVLRPPGEWGTPRPASPPLHSGRWDQVAAEFDLSPSQLAALRTAAEVGDARPAERRAA